MPQDQLWAGQWWEDNLTHQMLITVFYLLKAEDYQEPCRKVQWDLNRKVSDRESTCYPTVPFSSNDDYLLAAYLDLLSHFKFYHNFKMLMKENYSKNVYFRLLWIFMSSHYSLLLNGILYSFSQAIMSLVAS